MGLIDFVKGAGAKLFGKGDPEPEPRSGGDDVQAKLRELRGARNAALKPELAKHGLPTDGLDISIENDVIKVSGEVADQATREKIVIALGNTNGVSQVDDQIQVSQAEAAATYHTVERGDTLSKIAKEVYGNAMKYPVIFEANKPMLSDPDKIYPGQVLRIPPLED